MSSTLIYACLCRLCKARKLLLFLTSSTTDSPLMHQERISFIADCCPSQQKANSLWSVAALRLLSLLCLSKCLICPSTAPASELSNCTFLCAVDPCNHTSTPHAQPLKCISAIVACCIVFSILTQAGNGWECFLHVWLPGATTQWSHKTLIFPLLFWIIEVCVLFYSKENSILDWTTPSWREVSFILA